MKWLYASPIENYGIALADILLWQAKFLCANVKLALSYPGDLSPKRLEKIHVQHWDVKWVEDYNDDYKGPTEFL